MIIKERKFKTCKECGHQEFISGEEYGCDNCKEPIDYLTAKEERDYLSITVHSHNSGGKDFHFCSWGCALKKLKTIKTDYFISLPFLSYDMKNQEMGVKGFWDAIKRVA